MKQDQDTTIRKSIVKWVIAISSGIVYIFMALSELIYHQAIETLLILLFIGFLFPFYVLLIIEPDISTRQKFDKWFAIVLVWLFLSYFGYLDMRSRGLKEYGTAQYMAGWTGKMKVTHFHDDFYEIPFEESALQVKEHPLRNWMMGHIFGTPELDEPRYIMRKTKDEEDLKNILREMNTDFLYNQISLKPLNQNIHAENGYEVYDRNQKLLCSIIIVEHDDYNTLEVRK